MARNITDVIDSILKVVPEDSQTLRDRLVGVKRDAGFRAPEMMRLSWRALADVLEDEIGEPTLDWHHKVATIVQGTA